MNGLRYRLADNAATHRAMDGVEEHR